MNISIPFISSETNYEFLFSKCTHYENTFEKIEFTIECFFFKLSNNLRFFILTFTFVAIILIEIIANLCVILSILLENSKKRVDICFMSNAISDLMMGTVIMPITAIYTLFGHFPLSKHICFIWNCLDFICGTSSIFHIAFISFDRYLCIHEPLSYSKKEKSKFSIMRLPTYLIMLFIWIYSAIAWIPVIMYAKVNNKKTMETISNQINLTVNNLSNHDRDDHILFECNVSVPSFIILPHSFLVYYIPMFFICYFYSKSICIINHKKEILFQSHKTNKRLGFWKIFMMRKLTDRNKILLTKAKTTTLFNNNNNKISSLAQSNISNGKECINLAQLSIRISSSHSHLVNKISIVNEENENKKHQFKSLNNLYDKPSLISSNEKFKKDLNVSKNNVSIQQSIDSLSYQGVISKIINTPSYNSFDSKKKYQDFVPFSNANKTLINKDVLSSKRLIFNKPVDFFWKEKSVTYKLGLILITFFFSWLPFTILWCLISFCERCVSLNLYIFSFWLAYINSIFNPLILLKNNSKYRKSLNIISQAICKCLSGKSNVSKKRNRQHNPNNQRIIHNKRRLSLDSNLKKIVIAHDIKHSNSECAI